MEEESIVFWFETEDGTELEYELVATFDMEKISYAAFHPVDGEEGEVVLMAMLMNEEGEALFLPIEDDEEYEDAAELFEMLYHADTGAAPETDDPGQEEELFSEEDGELDEEDYCYEDSEGRLFLYGEEGQIIYLDEDGDPLP